MDNITFALPRSLCIIACVYFALALTELGVAKAGTAFADSPQAVDLSAKHATLPAGMVARVNGVPITVSQVDAVASKLGQQNNGVLRRRIKDELIAKELILQAAKNAHYDTRPEVVQAMETAKSLEIIQLYLQDQIHPAQVTDAQVKTRYDEFVASMGASEYKARLIVVADRNTANDVLAKLKRGVSFDALARDVSIIPSKTVGGALPWLTFKLPVDKDATGGVGPAIAQEISTLSAGDFSPEPIPADNRWVIVKLDERRPTVTPPFDKVKDAILHQLQQVALEKATADFVDGLMRQARIED